MQHNGALVLVAWLAACGGAAVAPVAEAVPPAPAPASVTPCFPDRPPLDAGDLLRQLEQHAWWWAQDEAELPPPEAFGTCTVHRGQIHSADGVVVAELGCGVQIFVPGIHDEVGIELGARGADVMARWTAPHGPMLCTGDGPDQARCGYERPEDGDTDLTRYVVAGALPPDVDALTGADAEVFFAPRRVVQIHYSGWCH
ncbi:MAG: hypothetical protein IPL61_05210 [Myxococcales bacterium]|nr:hypothetical protein [Myxococcales bacterium]